MEGLIGVLIGSAITVIVSYRNLKSFENISIQNRTDKYNLAAIEKRLEVHQTAYILWFKLINVLPDDVRKASVVKEANEFWLENCIYLDEGSRSMFKECISLVYTYDIIYNNWRRTNDDKILKETYEKIKMVGDTILKGIGASPISTIYLEKDYKGNNIK